MRRFPVDVPKTRVIRALGFRVTREGSHIPMVRENADGSSTPLPLPNHHRIKGSTLRRICTQSGISRSDFLEGLHTGVNAFRSEDRTWLTSLPTVVLVPHQSM